MKGQGHRAGGRTAIAAIAGLALVGATPVRAACIDEPVAAAARVHEFETMMMDVSLRCSRMGVAMQEHYDTMVSAHHTVFEDAAARLQRFFAGSAGSEPRHGGLYERYSTLLANHYGMGNTSLMACRLFDGVATEVARAADGGVVLGAVAKAMIEHSMLERATCPGQP